jgi:tetratricopeptide (TPR) repeat protein
LKGFELAGDWNFWREMAHHGVYYQYESPLGAFRRRVGQLSMERIGDYRAEIDRVVPLEVRRGRFEELDREQEWDANVIRSDDGSGRMVVGVESVREVYQKVGKSSLRSEQAGSNGWFEQAKRLQQEEENKVWDVAIASDQKRLQLEPNNWEDSYKLANALLEKGEVEEAIAHYGQSIQLNPNYSWSHHNLGEALVKQGNLSEAISEYQIALKLNPKFFWSNQKLELV